MLKRKEKSLTVVCVLLSFIVISPSFLGISSLQTGPTLLSVEEKSSTGWITPTLGSYRETKRVDRYTRIEKWTNGTKGHYASHIYLNDSECMAMWANFTAWFPENLTTQQTSHAQTASVRPLVESNLDRYPKDNVTFINGRNSTCYTTYEHDDNYETYYPLQWDLPFALQGLTKTHTHLAKGILDGWISGNISDFITLTICYLCYEALNAMSGDLISLMLEPTEAIQSKLVDEIVKSSADYLKSPLNVVSYGFWELVDGFIKWLESVYEPVARVVWMNFVVKEWFGGDAWAWGGPVEEWGFYAISSASWYRCLGPPLWEFRLSPRRRFDIYDARSWKQSYGSEGIFYGSPHDCTIAWCTRTEFNTTRAVFR